MPDDIYKLLVEYYNAAYDDLNFVSIAEASQNLGHSDRRVIVRPQINQFGRIQIRAEIFGTVNALRYLRNSFILAKFIQSNGSVKIYSGQVQFFFEHEVNILKERKTHCLAYVKWFKSVLNYQKRFHFQIDDDNESCNVEIWSKEFEENSRDCIIPVHNIYSQFIHCSYEISKEHIWL